MSQGTARTLNHYALFAFTEDWWRADPATRHQAGEAIAASFGDVARAVDFYQIFPAEHAVDFCVWTAIEADELPAADRFFDRLARAIAPHRRWIRPALTLWGYTRPSQYSRASRSAQEIDPFAAERRPYLVIYPFVKTAAWYALPHEERQRMMNEHIRIGKQYPEISQLLLYSFGIQDQEFVVVYEMDDLRQFSDLVAELRGAEGRIHTERDTPLHTALHRSAEEIFDIFG